MSTAAQRARTIAVLVSCAGRRIELMQAFRAAARRIGVSLHLLAADSVTTAPGLACADTPVVLPPISDAGYIAALRAAVREHGVQLLVPTIDTELPILSRHRDEFSADGCTALIADHSTVGLCRDKIETFHFLSRSGVDTPQTFLPDEIRSLGRRQFPYLLKPRFGSSSQSVHKLLDDADLEYHLQRVREPIVQEFVSGVEHTLDVYVGLSGRVQCVVPRARWQVRGGEVSKGVVVKDLEIMRAGRRVVEALGPSVRGVFTLQCIVTPERQIRFIEINPRFGGGAPLSIAAGADFPQWLMQEYLGEPPPIAFDGFRHGMLMLRYDWSAFVPLENDVQPRLAKPLRGFPEFQ
ncbi:MAG: ATP-grasp domain-containing protein [Phycisphaerae bacterium]